MEKIVIIINGNGGVGKDTLCDFANSKYKTTNISAITPIKNIALQHGWHGEKDPRSRKFLADLKQTFVEYNDLPCRYLTEQYEEFLKGSSEILFVHIREAEEIDKFRKCVRTPCVTLLIRREGILKNWGNASDDNVENYSYDYIYKNDKILSEAEDDFLFFLDDIIEENKRRDKDMIQVKEYRGHIRNWEALTEELGISQTLSREEREEKILIRAYEKWGCDMADHMHGMFAFALWDEEEQRLFCLRDQFGTKPFYYYRTADGELLYGTTIRGIMEQPGFVKELNEEMLQLYLSLTYVAGEDTFFKGVKKLLPGRYLIWKDGQINIRRYWKPEFHPDDSKSLEDWADEIHTTLKAIMPEVKEEEETAESFLSGGVDSSYVLAMSDIQMTDSCGYDEERFDESGLAAQTAELLGRRNSRCRITPEEYFEIVPYVMYNMEQPLGDASAIAFAIACKATAEHTKICYSGEGSDEFFGGYNMYRNAERYGDNLKTFYVGNTNIMKEDEKKRILKNYSEDILPIQLVKEIYEETEGLDPLTKMSDVDIQIWLEGDIYLNVDKMSTAAGLEIRMPLTDRRIFDIASRMPSKYKVNEEQNKVAFRMAAAKVLPEEIAFRKKLGFIVPIRIWMADDRYNQDVREKFRSEAAEKFFNVEEINVIFDDYKNGNSDNWRKVWTIYTFLVWYEEYFVKR